MTEVQRSLPKWILIVTVLFAIMEIAVSVSLCFSPESVLETVDLNAQGVQYVVYMWAVRQFALGVIFAFAAWKRSSSMLTLAYLFFFVMFVGDFFVGVWQKETSLIISALVMCIISTIVIIAINKNKQYL